MGIVEMKIAFLDPIVWDYNVDTPLTQPLGGSQSALCYLAAQLARMGHEVSLINNIAATADYSGVRCVRWAEGGNARLLNRADVVIVLNITWGQRLRAAGVRAPLILWSHNPHNESLVQGLGNGDERNAWTGFAFVSRWMSENYIRWFAIPPERARVLHNGIARPFEEQELVEPWFMRHSEPVLVYTSVPNRGLNLLLDAFPAVRAAFPDARLRIFSGMSLYRAGSDQDPYQSLYERSRTMQGVEYHEPIGQAQLARELAGAAALAYPTTVAETFCLAAAEAMALGAMLLTTRLGALPELFGEFAHMVDADIESHTNTGSRPDQLSPMRMIRRIWRYAAARVGSKPLSPRQKLATAYSALVIDALEAARRDPEGANERRKAQIAFIKTHYNWPRSAAEWITWLEGLIGGSADVPNQTGQNDHRLGRD
jgi:glycosyltransferase involved in cell wall biosynthesis